MKDILEDIVAYKRKEVNDSKNIIPERDIHSLLELKIDTITTTSLSKALSESNSGIIAEFKRRSPSLGWIKEESKADVIPLAYQNNGASAISILTDNKYFGGTDEFIQIARDSGVTLPILYKNFVIDEYQLFQARLCGASAVLLIAACLSKVEYRALLDMAHSLGLEVLLEVHSENEVEYADFTPDVCGVNNRNLGSFITDINNSFKLAPLLPKDTIKVSESGISNTDAIRSLQLAGFKGFLIGESFMKEENPGEELKKFIENL